MGRKKMIAALAALWLLAWASLALAAGEAYVSGGSADRVHLRAECSTQGTSMGLYFTGTPVYITGDAGNGWSAVVIGTQNGYMMTRYLSEEPAAAQTPEGVISPKNANSRVNLRGEPIADAPVLATLQSGTAVTVYGETKNGWYFVEAYGTQGYVKNTLVTLDDMVYEVNGMAQGGTASSGGAVLEQTLIAQIGGARVDIELTLLSREADRAVKRYSVRVERGGETTQTFLYATEGADFSTPTAYLTDVNMDGWPDLSLMRSTGATDAFASHYLYNPQTGLFEHDEALDWLSVLRCTLYPQTGYVLNYLHDGAATGAWELCRWQDGTLVQLARASILAPEYDLFSGRLEAKVERLSLGQWQTVYDEVFEADDSTWQNQYDAVLALLWSGVNPGEGQPLSEAFYGEERHR